MQFLGMLSLLVDTISNLASFILKLTLAKLMADGLQNDLEWLHALKRQLIPHQHLTKIVCTHPKKDHDIADGQTYCMNCNKDL